MTHSDSVCISFEFWPVLTNLTAVASWSLSGSRRSYKHDFLWEETPSFIRFLTQRSFASTYENYKWT
jgi:hypothetical protein